MSELNTKETKYNEKTVLGHEGEKKRTSFKDRWKKERGARSPWPQNKRAS